MDGVFQHGTSSLMQQSKVNINKYPLHYTENLSWTIHDLRRKPNLQYLEDNPTNNAEQQLTRSSER